MKEVYGVELGKCKDRGGVRVIVCVCVCVCVVCVCVCVCRSDERSVGEEWSVWGWAYR